MGTDKRKSYFTNEELATLKTAFDDACATLGLTPADEIHRAWLGEILFAIAAEKGGLDAESLQRQAIDAFAASRATMSAAQGLLTRVPAKLDWSKR